VSNIGWVKNTLLQSSSFEQIIKQWQNIYT